MMFLPECGLSPSRLDMHVRFSEEEGLVRFYPIGHQKQRGPIRFSPRSRPRLLGFFSDEPGASVAKANGAF